MSDSTSRLDLIDAAQAQKEVTANALFDAASAGMLFGRRASTSAALTWGYYGGALLVAGAISQVANGTLALSASSTNYIEVSQAGTVSKNTTGFTPGATALYSVVTGTAAVISWVDQRTFLRTPVPADFAGFYPGATLPSAILMRIPVARAIQLPAALAGSYGAAGTAATAQTDFDVKKNGSSVGTMRFAAAASTATFIAASAVTLAAGDILSVHAPASPDATLADIGFTLTGAR